MPAAEEARIATIGILAGAGELPRMLAARVRKEGGHPFLIAFKEQTDPKSVEGFDHGWYRLGATSKIIHALKSRHIEDLVMIGAIRRPTLRDLKPDLKTAEFFARNAMTMMGDDGLLKAIKRFLEGEGFHIHGIQKYLPELLAPAGVMGKITPSAQEKADVARGIEVLRTTALLDIGQAVIVQQGFVLGLEAAEGTDALLHRCASLRRKGGGGVLVKLCKLHQDQDLDMPTIGPETIENVADAGFSGVAVQAGSTLITDYERVIRIADQHKIFIMGVDGL